MVILGLISFAILIFISLLIAYLMKKLFIHRQQYSPRHHSTPRISPLRRRHIDSGYDTCDALV